MGLFSKKKIKEEKQEKKERYLSDILVNDSDGETKIRILDYTKNPADFITNLKNHKIEEEMFLVKVNGIIPSVNISKFEGYLSYDGFMLINDSFPIYIDGARSKDEILDFEFEELILKTARIFPVVITGRLYYFKIQNNGFPYCIRPIVLQLGEYISPRPKKPF